jgi:hypothetical protein
MTKIPRGEFRIRKEGGGGEEKRNQMNALRVANFKNCKS